MRIGTIAFSSQTGLGIQSRDFVEHMQPTKVLIDDLSAHNGMPVDHSWCPNARVVEHNDFVFDNGHGPNEHIEWLTDDVDIIVIQETPLNHGLFVRARQKGVKTLQIVNAEFVDGYRHPDWPRADYVGMPTSWHNDEVRQLDMGEMVSWPIPVDRKKFPYRKIERCETFVHIIGRPTYLDRNGTLTFLEAARRLNVRRPGRFQYRVFFQEPTDPKAQQHFEGVFKALERAEAQGLIGITTDFDDPKDMYQQGEVLVLPRRYGGLCLPMQEALSCGLPVLMTDISPNTDRLPKGWLVPARFKDNFFFHAPVDVYDGDDYELSWAMEAFDKDMTEANIKADEIAEALSWDNLKPYYLETLERCLK